MAIFQNRILTSFLVVIKYDHKAFSCSDRSHVNNRRFINFPEVLVPSFLFLLKYILNHPAKTVLKSVALRLTNRYKIMLSAFEFQPCLSVSSLQSLFRLIQHRRTIPCLRGGLCL